MVELLEPMWPLVHERLLYAGLMTFMAVFGLEQTLAEGGCFQAAVSFQYVSKLRSRVNPLNPAQGDGGMQDRWPESTSPASHLRIFPCCMLDEPREHARCRPSLATTTRSRQGVRSTLGDHSMVPYLMLYILHSHSGPHMILRIASSTWSL